MKQRRINATLTTAVLALTTLLILTVLPRAGTAAPRLERQPLESLSALNGTEATESDAPLSVFSVLSAASVVQSPGTTTRISTALRSGSVMFIENVGQFVDGARFQVHGGTGTTGIMWLAEDAIWITVFEQRSKGTEEPRSDSPPHLHASAPSFRSGANIKLSFPGANPHPRIEPFDCLDTVISYFIGNDPDQWHPDVPVWGGVRYVDLYPGVDLEITSQSDLWTWRAVVADGAALSQVRLRVEGTNTLTLDGNVLRLTTALGDFTLPLLAVEDAIPDGQLATFNLERGTFEVSSPFSSVPLLPHYLARLQDNPEDLLYSTLLGGEHWDYGHAIAVDEAGSAYVTGETWSSDFPTTPGAFDTSFNDARDAFVVKLNASGTGLVYATFLGGSSEDGGYPIAVDGAGSAYVTGWTRSSDFPTTAGAFDTSHNDYSDAFVAKLNANGTELAYATFLGGSDWDDSYAVALDGAGSAYVTGETRSSDFPTTPGAFDTSYNGDDDAFVVKVNASGTGLIYATFLAACRSNRIMDNLRVVNRWFSIVSTGLW